jgi:LmbE family N-acetylglucosaminyl deacetylase
MLKLLRKKLRWFVGRRSYKWVVRDWVKIDDLNLCAKVLMTDRFRKNLETLVVEPPGRQKKILVIAPHQDDETIGAGGTLLKAANNGADISCIYVTDGSMATNDVPGIEMMRIREKEAREVWKEIGGKTIFLRFPDGAIPLNEEASEILSNEIKKIDPDIIFVPFLLDNHLDHINTNCLFWLACDKINKKKIEVWAYQVWSGLIPNVAVDITDVSARKRNINKLWQSQNNLRDFVHYSDALSAYNTKYISTNKSLHIEIFFVVPIKEYFDLCQLYFGSYVK